MNIVELWGAHGTKVLGTLAAIVSTALLIEGLIPDAHMKYWLFANALLGGGVVKRGFTNTTAAKASSAQGGFARVWMLAALTMLALVLLTACGGTRSVYEQANNPVQYAKAVLLHHNAIGEQVVFLIEDPLVSDASKELLTSGYRATVCAKSEASVSTAECDEGPAYQLQRAAEAAELTYSATTEEELQRAVDELVGLLTQLIVTISEARR